MPLNIRTSIATIALLSATTLACSRGDEQQQPPPAQSQTTTATPLNTPATVTGCLRAGDATDTFVLTTTRTDNGVNPATYQLAGSGGVNLRDHVGKNVSVTGVITDQQHVATTESRTPTGDKAQGTAGTPTVQTATQVAVRRIEVKQVQSAGGDCPQEERRN